MESTLGHYRIVRQLGAGGTGEVYLAEDRRLERRVALKLLPPRLAADTEHLLRFEDVDGAVARIERAYDERDPQLPFIKILPVPPISVPR